MSQMNIHVSANADELERDSQEVLEQLSATRKKLDSGELSEADLVAWKHPRVALHIMEMSFRTLDLFKDLQSHVKELQQQNRKLRENLALINEMLFDFSDDDLGGDQEASVPSDHSPQSTDLIH